MSNRRDLKYLRRAQKQAKRQLHQLAKLELTGLTAVTLHAHNRQLTVTLVSETGAPFTDELRQALRERRQALQAEARQLLATWLEDEQLRDQLARLPCLRCPNGFLNPAESLPLLTTQRLAPACPIHFLLLLRYVFSHYFAPALCAGHSDPTAQILLYLQTRLQLHFPTLHERPFVRTLAECRPTLLLSGTQVALSHHELTQLIQYLGNAPELPLLDPPLYGRFALELAQYLLHTNELTVSAVIELASKPDARCGPRLGELLRRTARPYPLAEQVVQAQRWDLPGSFRLPAGIPGGGPAPSSQVVEDLLQQLLPLANQPTK